MTANNILPDEGFVKLPQIIGQREITPDQAKHNQLNPVTTSTGKPKFVPKRPRPGIPPIIPISKTQWYQGIKDGKYPAPLHLGNTAVWRVSDIRKLLAAA
jgi:hypothetical protein